MPTDVSVKSDKTLNTAGNLTNGAVSTIGMLMGIQPGLGAKTFYQTRKPGEKLPSFRQLWRGLHVNLISVGPAQTAGFVIDGIVRKNLLPEKPSHMQTIGSGFLSGFVSGVLIANPSENLVTKMQKHGESVRHHIDLMRKSEGIFRGLAKGGLATGTRDGMVLAGILGAQDAVGQMLKPIIKNENIRSPASSFLIGFITGCGSNVPDRVRAQMHIGYGGNSLSMFKTAREIVRESGVVGLNKAMLPRGVVVGCAFVPLGELKKIIPRFLPNAFHDKQKLEKKKKELIA